MKNDSYARGHTVLLAWTTGSGIPVGETVQSYVRRLDESGIKGDEAFLCQATDKGFRVPEMGKAYSNSGIFRVLLRQVYEDVQDNDALASRFSWHSLRRGGATWATRCG
eukprot:3324874-Rhodomonas_salina.1